MTGNLVLVKSGNTSGWPYRWFWEFFDRFHEKPILITLHMTEEHIFSDWTLTALCWILFTKTFDNVIRMYVLRSSWTDWMSQCNLSCKTVKNFRIIVLNRAKKKNSLRDLYDKKKKQTNKQTNNNNKRKQCLIVLFTSDVMYEKYIYKAGLHATRFATKIYLH